LKWGHPCDIFGEIVSNFFSSIKYSRILSRRTQTTLTSNPFTLLAPAKTIQFFDEFRLVALEAAPNSLRLDRKMCQTVPPLVRKSKAGRRDRTYLSS
jgi:hypothetical protein